MTQDAIRVQFVCGTTLAAEAIFENGSDASEAVSAYFRLKYRRRLPLGGAQRARADLPRYWDVPVGANVEGRALWQRME